MLLQQFIIYIYINIYIYIYIYIHMINFLFIYLFSQLVSQAVVWQTNLEKLSLYRILSVAEGSSKDIPSFVEFGTRSEIWSNYWESNSVRILTLPVNYYITPSENQRLSFGPLPMANRSIKNLWSTRGLIKCRFPDWRERESEKSRKGRIKRRWSYPTILWRID